MNNQNPNQSMMQNSGIMHNGGNQMTYNNQTMIRPPLDEINNFENELSMAPPSQPNNYVYAWNKQLKRYTCYDEAHLYQNHRIDEDSHEYFLKTLHKMPRANPYTKTRMLSLIGGILLVLLAILFLILGIVVSNAIWKTALYFLMSFLIILAVLSFVYFFMVSKKSENKRMKKRRSDIREFLAVNNKMSFHLRNRHWRPSPYCSYLTYMMNYYSDKGDYDSAKTKFKMKNRLAESSLNPVLGESMNRFNRSYGMTGKAPNPIMQSSVIYEEKKFKKPKQKILKSRKRISKDEARQSPFLRGGSGMSTGPLSEVPQNLNQSKGVVQKKDHVASKKLNLMNSGSKKSYGMSNGRYSNKKIDNSFYKENLQNVEDPLTIVRMNTSTNNIRKQNPTPQIVRRISSDFNKLDLTPKKHAGHSFHYPEGIKNLSSHKPVLQPQGAYINSSTPIREQRQRLGFQRVVQPGNTEKVTYRREGVNTGIGVDRGQNRRYKNIGHVIRITPPKGSRYLKSPAGVQRDSIVLDKSMNGLLGSISKMDNNFLRPR